MAGVVRLVHRVAGETRDLATEVDLADGLLAQARGLMFRSDLPEGYAMAFRFDRPDDRVMHMLFVPVALDVLWLVGDEVAKKRRLRPWVGVGWGTADTVVELPAGAADDVQEGDVVELVDA